MFIDFRFIDKRYNLILSTINALADSIYWWPISKFGRNPIESIAYSGLFSAALD